jgi:hypothetical protein
MQTTIPLIDDEVLKDAASRFHPVILTSEGFRAIEKVDLRGTSFIWDPVLVGPPLDLVPVRMIPSYHDWGYYGLFKPSVAEVLSAMQKHDLLNDVREGFFWLDKSSVQMTGERLLHCPDEENKSGYHRALVLLLRKKS